MKCQYCRTKEGVMEERLPWGMKVMVCKACARGIQRRRKKYLDIDKESFRPRSHSSNVHTLEK